MRMILHLAAFAIFLVICSVILYASFMGAEIFLGRSEDGSASGETGPGSLKPSPRRRSLFALAAAGAFAWVLIAGMLLGRSITGYGSSGFSGDGPSYMTEGNPLEPVMFGSSGVAAILLVGSCIVAKKRKGCSKWTGGLAALSVWILMANFLAYCLGCTLYEVFLKQ